MKIITALLVAFSCAECAASVTNTTLVPETGCPVTLDRVHLRHREGDYTPLTLRYTNTTQLKVIGIKLTVGLMDATGDFDSLGDVTSAEQLKVRESSVFGSWDLLTLTGFAGFRVVVKKVSFSDGTTWESGEDINRCVYAEDHRTK